MSTYCHRGLTSKREAQEQEIVPPIDITTLEGGDSLYDAKT